MEEKQPSFFQNMTQAQVFLFGIAQGFLVLCTIGFFILLPGSFSSSSSSKTPVLSAPVAQAPNQPTAGAPTGSVPLVSEDDHVRGNANAPLTIIEYSDIECPFCQRFHETMKQVLAAYPQVNWVYRHFPLESIHPNARLAAAASECAGEQGKFWEYIDAAFEQQNNLNRTGLVGIASTLKLNQSAFSTCIDSKKYDTLITQQAQDAQRAGGQGTPFSVLVTEDGQSTVISGAQPFEAVAQVVQQFVQ